MFSSKDRGGGSDDEQFTEALSRLKRRGASVLVVGSVRTEQRRDICHRLLGQESVRPRRRVLVSTTGEDHDVSYLVDDEFADPETLSLVSYATQSRSAAAGTTGTGLRPGASSAVSTDESPITTTTLADLGIAISTAIDEFERDTDGLAPGELRISVESLIPLLEEYGAERVFKFVHLTNGRTRDADGMIHYHLPMARDADVVSVLTPLFDIVVELRDQNGVFQERWTINDGDHSSGWLSMGQS